MKKTVSKRLPLLGIYTQHRAFAGPIRNNKKGRGPSRPPASPVLPLRLPTMGSQSDPADPETQPHPLEPCVGQRPSSQGVHSMHRPELKMRNAARLEAGKSKLSPANHQAEHMHVKDRTVVCSFLSQLNILHVPL